MNPFLAAINNTIQSMGFGYVLVDSLDQFSFQQLIAAQVEELSPIVTQDGTVHENIIRMIRQTGRITGESEAQAHLVVYEYFLNDSYVQATSDVPDGWEAKVLTIQYENPYGRREVYNVTYFTLDDQYKVLKQIVPATYQ